MVAEANAIDATLKVSCLYDFQILQLDESTPPTALEDAGERGIWTPRRRSPAKTKVLGNVKRISRHESRLGPTNCERLASERRLRMTRKAALIVGDIVPG
jgi:hypothetical protein